MQQDGEVLTCSNESLMRPRLSKENLTVSILWRHANKRSDLERGGGDSG